VIWSAPGERITLTKRDLITRAAASEAHAVLVYRVRASGVGSMAVELVLLDAAKQTALELNNVIPDRYGLITWKRWFVLSSVAASFLLLGWVGFVLMRGRGQVRVKINADPDTSQHLFSILINRSRKPPSLKNPRAYVERLSATAARITSNAATHVFGVCLLPRVNTGKYHVHLFGTCIKTGVLQLVSASRPIQVDKGCISEIHFDLEPKTFQLRLIVFDGDQPVVSAPVSSEVLGGLPEELDQVLASCLAKNQDDRPSSVAELRVALQALRSS
jgi:hypothetical protein